jgi:predicted MFS family arabinose efflux permease
MALVGGFVSLRFGEHNFTRAKTQKWRTAVSIFRRGLRLSRRDREVLLVLVATMTVNGAAMISWAFPKQLVDRGFPSSPVLWYAALGILSFGVGILALHFVEARIGGVGVARRTYALSCFVGMLGLLVLAYAPRALEGSAGILVVNGITFNVTRTVSTIWINRRTPSDIRATMHSFLSQAESVGEIVGGATLAGVARLWGIVPAIVASGLLVALAGAIVARSRADR